MKLSDKQVTAIRRLIGGAIAVNIGMWLCEIPRWGYGVELMIFGVMFLIGGTVDALIDWENEN